MTGKKPRQPRKQNRNVENHNADNHAVLLSVVGETPDVKPHIPRVVVFDELRHLGVLHSRRQVDRLEAAGRFPKRIAMGTGRVGWLATEIIEYINDRVAQRSTAIGTLGSDSTLLRKRPIRNAPMFGAKAKRKAEVEAEAEADTS
jgi:prophage regulatory protein